MNDEGKGSNREAIQQTGSPSYEYKIAYFKKFTSSKFYCLNSEIPDFISSDNKYI